MSNSRKRRGADTQRVVAAWYADHGFPFATAAGAGAPGKDIQNMIGLAPEVKARSDFNPLAWIRQARRNATPADLPFVVVRPNGYGPERVGEWLVIRRLDDDTALLRGAGYGDPETERAA